MSDAPPTSKVTQYWDLARAKVQALIDWLHWMREWSVCAIIFLSMRCFGVELSWSEVQAGRYTSKLKPIEREEIGAGADLDGLLDLAKDTLAKSCERRDAVADKAQTLLKVTSVLLGLIGLLLPKYLALDHQLARTLGAVGVIALFNTLILLISFYRIGTETYESVRDSLDNDEEELKKVRISSLSLCECQTENRTNYLVDLFKTAKFFFLLAFVAVFALSCYSLLNPSKGIEEKIIAKLRSNEDLVELLRGPKGKPGDRGQTGFQGLSGEKGDPGIRGEDARVDNQAIINQLLATPGLRTLLAEEVAKAHEQKDPD